jgi:hypothetical protein
MCLAAVTGRVCFNGSELEDGVYGWKELLWSILDTIIIVT